MTRRRLAGAVGAIIVGGQIVPARADDEPPSPLASDEAGAARITRDAHDHPGLFGEHLELVTDTALPALGSDDPSRRLRGAADLARQLGPFTLRLHGHVGAAHNPDGPSLDSAGLRRFAARVDPRGDLLGAVQGDSAEAMAHVELELPISRRRGLSLAVFADAGVRHHVDPGGGRTEWITTRSAGAALIWRSRIGQLRLDIARSLGGDSRELGGFMVFLSLGTTW